MPEAMTATIVTGILVCLTYLTACVDKLIFGSALLGFIGMMSAIGISIAIKLVKGM
jgi:hypothetical protein